MKASILAVAAFAASVIATPVHKDKNPKSPFVFTSTYSIVATPDQVVNPENQFTGGLEGAIGYYNFGINSYENTICYNITLIGFRGEYQSGADTATHIHEAPRGQSGPPRIAFPNPVDQGGFRRSIGCLTGPFMTGIEAADGSDTGAGFHVSQIEAGPMGFFADVHSSLAVPGAVRGQFGRKNC
ncbi:hypothetical protein S7711_06211 [Stachybotrys chartarum IBT 7711]|uniref:CHRD domain-containing protein n=1 Tax=Stachybotrys chartarum (strain CBS 109288 / IBT 7711) TaxID=1280523 RepID=A0A084AWA3_STACB|nr:hypothetical protein S7711_06211 [Stachybotrys chartarum IBT 7711]KFA49255.1 hypothetical protein S40293_08327 [Stachybotrys chartarum IBT 40293]KFA71475.1 hypothetical protein S40288_08012 [Stachybotrys chartarum IBT 40288]